MKDARTKSVLIFGYGSLMSLESLRAHVPDAENLRKAYVKGFRREFSKWDPIGWKSMYQELAGIPFCAVDVITSNEDERVNGVVFMVSTKRLLALKSREIGYKLLEVPVYDFETDENLGKCLIFSAGTRDGSYSYDEPAQELYTKLCVDAAKEYGDDFYEQFLATTYIGAKTLKEILPDAQTALAKDI
jgi:cation transport regulator ChaC